MAIDTLDHKTPHRLHVFRECHILGFGLPDALHGSDKDVAVDE